MTLQEKMIDYRAQNGISQAAAASAAGITTQTWCGVERGIQKPSRLTEGKIMRLIREEVKNESVNNAD